MPVDHLTTAATLATAVRTLLAGADPATVAAEHGITQHDLNDAAHTYHLGGLAALEQAATNSCYDVRVEFPDWTTAETTATTHLGPAVDALHDDGAITGWWFLRKHPCWRFRLHDADHNLVGNVLNELTTAGHLTRWWPTLYEPETTAFGGTTSMATIHDLFCADSRGVLNHLRHPSTLGRRELSILLLTALFHSAGLDTFERGDVFDRVAHLRPTPDDAQTAKVRHLASTLHTVVSLNDPSHTDLFADAGPAEHAMDWLTAFQLAGRQLGDAATNGNLGRGLRAILTHIVIFHWNRLGLSAASQAVLARAAATALLP